MKFSTIQCKCTAFEDAVVSDNLKPVRLKGSFALVSLTEHIGFSVLDSGVCVIVRQKQLLFVCLFVCYCKLEVH